MTTRPDTPRRPRLRRGSTLIELMVVVVMTGILAAVALPSFQKAMEQARVDQAASTLRTIWAAQRFYRLDHPGTYAGSIAALAEGGLIDERLSLGASSQPFGFVMTLEDGATGFEVVATRKGSSVWSGHLTITASGAVDGGITGVDGDRINPPRVFQGGSP
jgi:type IV pilus assembly protein PilE